MKEQGVATSSRIDEILDYYSTHGERKTCKTFCIKPSTLERYQRTRKTTESDEGTFADILRKIEPVRYNQHPRLFGDTLLINDLHIPFVNVNLLNKALRVAEIFKIRQMLVIGDFIDCESISPFDFGGDQYEIHEEFKIALEFMRRLEGCFDRIVMLRGNHENRIIKFLKRVRRAMDANPDLAAYHSILKGGEGKPAWEEYRDYFTSERVEISPYPLADVENRFRCVHPKSYSRHAGNAELLLCEKYDKHIVGTHGHMTGLRFNKSGKHIALQLGGLVDGDMIYYRGMQVTTHPEWNPAFGWIKNGKLGYYIEHPDLMNIFDYLE